MVLLPLFDDDPLEGKTRPYVTYGIIVANIVVSIFVLMAPAPTYESLLHTLGVIPAVEIRTQPNGGPLPTDVTLLTSMFVHRDWWHLAGNMIFFWIFGDDVEDALGHVRFLIFYIVCGVVGALAFVAVFPDTTSPLMGASGAIAGVMAAYMMLRPCARIEILAWVWPVAAPAYVAIGLWLVMQLLDINSNDGVAYMAHLGGAAAGAIMVVMMRPAGVELFDCVAPNDDSADKAPAE